MPDEKFPFLENFLIGAEDFWLGDESGTLKSGIWSEIDISGNEYHLEASAVRLPTKNILLISLLGCAYEEKQYLIQTGRENSLIYYHVLKVDHTQAPNAVSCAIEVVNSLLPTFSIKKMQLQMEPNIDMAAD